LLDPLEYKLFTALREGALVYFDATKKKWILVEDVKSLYTPRKGLSSTASITSSGKYPHQR